MSKEIKNISIIGLGLIGGSIAKALKNSNNNFFISAFDKEDVLLTALHDKVIDKSLKSIDDALDSDLIFLCLPLEQNLLSFKQLAPKIPKGNILTDVSGIKSAFQNEWNSVNSKGFYIGGHPMAGKEIGGYKNSDPLLFENSVYIVTEDLNKVSEFKEFKNIVELLGANILFIPAKQHDVIAASVSHLPQLLAVTLVNTASLKTDDYNFLDLAAGGFRDLTRIASSDFNIWDEVIRKNKNQIIAAIDEFSYELDNVKKWISQNNSDKLSKYFDDARKSRDEIPKNSKGFITPIYDIFIFVKDEPGVISKISTRLYEANINIKDIELLKIREGTGGTFRLSFASKDIAEKAKALLENIGFKFKDH
ncbi:MAG: prephenate dehydrogenase/arogenate dehydrogenase family protein [Ignavibacteriales bacterium]|nr:prephenate dehydrogenase/arogenate dehydrogenase family protein [Ignavibacteriales bacterium]MCB9218008.1 prephenate dehydrogenase/arogenate dehydrogenase family protein [Ignavibacteriales bacterium]